MKKVILTILDGWGLNEGSEGNAILAANPKTFNYLWENYPHSKLEAGGKSVGLPEGQMGNSEVGHMNIGAGRIIWQPLELINNKIEDKTFFKNEKILEVIDHVKKNKSKLHIMGLLSDGGVHSHQEHLYALMQMCKDEGIEELYYHVFLDGRDTLPDQKEKFLKELVAKIESLAIGELATISGRYYAMDRDNRWERIKPAYDAIAKSRGTFYYSLDDFLLDNKLDGTTDEFVKPSVLSENGKVMENDGIIVFNFRPDRIRELFTVFTNPSFKEFEAIKYENLKVLTMMPLSDDVIASHAFDLEKIENGLGTYLSELGLKQLRIAETEKYAHVTYFFDGGVEKHLRGCDRILIPSPKVATYDLLPEMSAEEVCQTLLREMSKYDCIILNFANGDMVGHTGVFEAAVKAVEKLDDCLRRIYEKTKELDMIMIVTADHGNCEEMIKDGKVLTAHSLNPVPFIVTKKDISLKDGKLADIAPTILELMEIAVPIEMTGQSLIE